MDDSADANIDEENDEDFGSDSDGNNSDGDDDSLDSENGVAKVRGTNHGII